jgi:hypothetical protein
MVDGGMAVVRVLHNIDNLGPKAAALLLILPLLATNMLATSLIGYKAWYVIVVPLS